MIRLMVDTSEILTWEIIIHSSMSHRVHVAHGMGQGEKSCGPFLESCNVKMLLLPESWVQGNVKP
jgi:hypothetical protein